MEVENTLNVRNEYLKWSDKDKNMVELLVWKKLVEENLQGSWVVVVLWVCLVVLIIL